MKKIYKDKITNIENTDKFDNKFLFDVMTDFQKNKVEIIFMSDLLEKRKNTYLLEKVKGKPAMYSNVYSPKDELEIFEELFDNAISNNKKIHIVGITLKSELEILEKYYEKLGFLREDINCYEVDFNIPLVTVSVKIENIMYKGSDYKAMREKIFFNPPIRESGQVKSMFKGINKGTVAGIYLDKINPETEAFLSQSIKEEKILPLTLGKVLNYNLSEVGIEGEMKEIVVEY